MTGPEFFRFRRGRSDTGSRPRATLLLVLIMGVLGTGCRSVHEPPVRQGVLIGTWVGLLGVDGGSPSASLRLDVTAHRPALGVERFTGFMLVNSTASLGPTRRFPVEGHYSPSTREVSIAPGRYLGFVDEAGTG